MEISISSVLWVMEVLCCIYRQFLSYLSLHVKVDGCMSKLINVMSGVPQDTVLVLL